MSAPAIAPSILTGRKVFLIIACFFATFITADSFLLVMAVRSFSGTEATSAYKAGQLYNGELERARAQEARHWSVAVRAVRDSSGDLRVTADLRDSEGRSLTGRTVTASLERPTDRREDRSADLVEVAPGRYDAPVPRVAAGQWDLVVDVLENGERAFRRRTRIVVP